MPNPSRRSSCRVVTQNSGSDERFILCSRFAHDIAHDVTVVFAELPMLKFQIVGVGRETDRHARDQHVTEDIVVYPSQGPRLDELWVSSGFGYRQHWRGGYPVRLQLCNDVVPARFVCQPLLDNRSDFVAIGDSAGCGCVSRVSREFRPPHRRAGGTPLLIVSCRNHDVAFVANGEHAHPADYWMHVPSSYGLALAPGH